MRILQLLFFLSLFISGCGNDGKNGGLPSLTRFSVAGLSSGPVTGADGKPENPAYAHTIAGEDHDNNGVRDDVDRYIDARFDTPEEKRQ